MEEADKDLYEKSKENCSYNGHRIEWRIPYDQIFSNTDHHCITDALAAIICCSAKKANGRRCNLAGLAGLS